MKFSHGKRSWTVEFYWAVSYYVEIVVRRVSRGVFLLVNIFLIFSCRNSQDFENRLRHRILLLMQPYIWLVGEEKRLVTGIQQVVENVLGLFRETSQLRRENHELHLKLGEFTLLQQENEELRNLLQLTVDSKSENYTPKRLQLLSRSGVVQRINIDFSEKDVWREQDVVVDKIGNFVGRVVNVRKNRAEILLVSDYMSKIPALLASSGRRVILAGNGDEFLDMAYFFNNDQVALEGESVYTSSDGDILPAGIPIGQVVVRKSKFLVKINASLSSLNWVLVRHKSVPTGP